MLSGEGNSGERWKTTISLISKNWATLHVQHFALFLYISFPLFCTTTSWNFQKLLSYTFYERNVVRFLVHFFFTAPHYHLALVGARISHFVTAATKFSSCSSSCRPFFRWRLSFAGLPPIFSFSLSFSCSIFQIFGHGNYSKLNTLENTDTETYFRFPFSSSLTL